MRISETPMFSQMSLSGFCFVFLQAKLQEGQNIEMTSLSMLYSSKMKLKSLKVPRSAYISICRGAGGDFETEKS